MAGCGGVARARRASGVVELRREPYARHMEAARPAWGHGKTGGEAKRRRRAAPLFRAEREAERRKKKGGFEIFKNPRGLIVK